MPAAVDALTAAIRAGDAEAFETWLAGAESRLRESLRSFATRVDVEAVLQETLLRVWQVAPRFEPDGRPDGLVRLALRIARNGAVDQTRRTRLVPVGSEMLEAVPDDTGVTSAPDLPADPLLRGVIDDCWARLPARPAAALQARLDSGGMEPDVEVAERVGMRANTFAQNLRRARRFLAECLRARGVDIAEEVRVTEHERLVEEAGSAWRPRRAGAVQPHPAWADLDGAGRREAYEVARVLRLLEAARDPRGVSTTGRAVLARIRRRP
jgi:RNA polymerase sigma-70 factor (ECF subfamily)